MAKEKTKSWLKKWQSMPLVIIIVGLLFTDGCELLKKRAGLSVRNEKQVLKNTEKNTEQDTYMKTSRVMLNQFSTWKNKKAATRTDIVLETDRIIKYIQTGRIMVTQIDTANLANN